MSSHCYPMHQVVTGCGRVVAMCVHFVKLFQEKRGLRGIARVARQINILDCQPDVLHLALPHIEKKLAQEPLHESYGRQNIPIDPAATLPEHHSPCTNEEFVTHDCSILKNSFEARNLASTRDENTTPQFFRYETICLNNMWH